MRVRLPIFVKVATLSAVVMAVPLATSQTSVGAALRAVPRSTLIAPQRSHVAPGVMARFSPTLRPATSSTALLTYYGGPVLANMNSVDVLWGAGSYQPFVTNSYLSQFTTQYLGSGVNDWLNEYNTPTINGTGQVIGRGTYGGSYTITPANTNTTLQDTDVQSELIAQINAGNLPTPNVNTSYALFFPQGITICFSDGSCSGQVFCAYHGTFTIGSVVATYQVMPDNQVGSGDASGCGTGTAQANETSVLSHELVETITDPQVGLATTLAKPLGWYDQTNGEIGDICNGQQGSWTGADGTTYVTQEMFSNTVASCVLNRTVAPAFLSAASTTFTVGTAGTFSASATGWPLVSYSESGALPAGVTMTNATLSGTPTQSGVFPLTLRASNGVGTDAIQPFVLTVTQAPHISSAASVTFVKGVPGTFTVKAVGDPTVHFSVGGVLPSGIHLSSAGVLSGIAKTTGTFAFHVVASNGTAPNASQLFSLKVVGLLITTVTLGTATRGKGFSFQLAHQGGVATLVWSAIKLPAGLTMSSAGKISGVVSKSIPAGTYKISVTVHDSAKPTPNKAVATLKLIVK